MKKDFEEELKKLFEYQKFEDNPKLKQVINDTDLNSALISDLELAKVSGAIGFGNVSSKKCPSCGRKNTILIYGANNTSYEFCTVCKYTNKSKFLSIK